MSDVVRGLSANFKAAQVVADQIILGNNLLGPYQGFYLDLSR
jgi:hypothetical protein